MPALSMTLHLHAGHVVATRPADRGHIELDRHRAGLLECQRRLDVVAGSERLFQADEHEVEGAGLQLDGFARLDFEASLDRTHLHDPLVHGHRMELDLGRHIRGAPRQTIGCRPAVRNLHVAGPDGCTFRRGARPRTDDVQRSAPIVARICARRRNGQQGGEERRDRPHGLACGSHGRTSKPKSPSVRWVSTDRIFHFTLYLPGGSARTRITISFGLAGSTAPVPTTAPELERSWAALNRGSSAWVNHRRTSLGAVTTLPTSGLA